MNKYEAFASGLAFGRRVASGIEETIENQEVFRTLATSSCIERELRPVVEHAPQEIFDAWHAGELTGIDQIWLEVHLPRLIRRN